MNDEGTIGLFIGVCMFFALLGTMYFIFNPNDAGSESVTVTDVEIDGRYITIIFNNGEETSYRKSRVDASLIHSFKDHNAVLYYTTVLTAKKTLSDFRVFFEKNTTIKQVIYEKDGFWIWDKPPVKIIFGDGSNLKIQGSGDYKFDVYSKCIVHNGNPVILNYYYDGLLDVHFRSVKPRGS